VTVLRLLRRRVVAGVLVALAALVLVGCSPLNQGAVTRDRATGRPALVLALCDGEAVEAVQLMSGYGAERRVLWRIEARRPRRITRIVVDEIPPGFVETVARQGSLPRGSTRMVLAADMTGGKAASHSGSFRLDELRTGVLLHNTLASETSEGELRRSARINCSNNLLLALGLPEWSTWAVWAVPLALVCAYVAVKVLRLRRAASATSAP